ncbi:hydroxyethylthiazole kinase [Pseudarthrobacter sp. NamB4]|uniref:hydroxyethylthiazole kinase n=1 Tax=Pseudarthrobacter sp. NamB4 TaxID=2576837 RepID=UPI001485A5A4|nr:hydroxyethylthiazole kinase [Pseudarthrobacter sp. NamB4]
MTIRLTPAHAWTMLERVRETTPLIQCLTNTVVTNFTANVLLALGAAPAMVDVPSEARPFARVASGVLVNVGTPHEEQRAGMREAVGAAREAGTPWVLDPVAVGVLPVRTALAAELLDCRPTAVRGNASEVLALAGEGQGGRGVDAVDGPEAALEAASGLAYRYGSVVAVSGPTDVITDGTDVIRVSNGHPYLTQVTGGGCALGAVTAAFPAVDDDPLAAAAAATAVYTVAADLAAEGARGPGTFAVAFLDALTGIDAPAFTSRVVIS